MLLIHGFHKNLLYYTISAFHFQSFPPSTELLPPRKRETERTKPGTVVPGSLRTTLCPKNESMQNQLTKIKELLLEVL